MSKERIFYFCMGMLLATVALGAADFYDWNTEYEARMAKKYVGH